MLNRWTMWLPAAFMVAGSVFAEGVVENVSPGWRPADRQRLGIGGAEASASLGEQYAPNRVCDGSCQTKWVSPVKPSEAAPQWVALSLLGRARQVSAVAVFGERIDNDGILDADIQVESGGTFRTVASVRNTTSSGWAATFAPVRTSRVRLLVLRSGGPTDHTDVYEIEVYGEELSEAEMKAYMAEQLANARKESAAVAEAMAGGGQTQEGTPAWLAKSVERLRADVAALDAESRQWDQMDCQSRSALAQKVDRLVVFASRMRERIGTAGKAGKDRMGAIVKGREEGVRVARAAARAGAVAAEVGGERALLANNKLAVSVDLKSGTWNAVWSEGTDAAVIGAAMTVEAGGPNVLENLEEASVDTIHDALGKGKELLQIWKGGGLMLGREFRVYDGTGVITIGGWIVNAGDKEVRLGTTELVNVSDSGWWWTGHALELPAAVHIVGHSQLQSMPFESPDGLSGAASRGYGSSGVLTLTSRDPAVALTVGYLKAEEASPDITANFEVGKGGTGLGATMRFLGRVLGPGEAILLNRMYVSADDDAYRSLETYGQAMADFSQQPVRTGATSLWCSWYAHRMGMTEEKVLANAEVAAKHFKPLGLEIMQLDHGWQRGDVTGDWVPNERFGHGLKWLADQLRDRYGLRLGVWISPTDAAETSEVFKKHPEWMLKDGDGKPRVNWRWYWVPNPNCYELDATHPDAYKYIEDCFRQLTEWGVSYYKIDFIASAGGEHFVQHDPKSTRGWSVLWRSMEALRKGAGEKAWIRYCQTPPVLSVGLADSVIGGGDTLDAGVPGRFDVLRENARHLAAGYWLNDRPYHREVCDMSVRMQGSDEEVRVRAAMMTLAGCSISFSDEFCYLPPSRIRLMQQCLPPGNPAMKPVDLFDRDTPSIWHIRAKNQADLWDVVGFFNFNKDGPEVRSVRFDQIGLDVNAEYALFEFWEERFLGVHKGGIDLTLPPESSRILSIRKLTGIPQLVGTDMHVLQGYHEIKQLSWDTAKGVLSGSYSRMPGIRAKAFFYLPEGYYPKFDFPLSPASARLTYVGGRIWVQEIEFKEKEFSWSIPFETPKKQDVKEPIG